MHSGFNAVRNALPMNIRASRYVESLMRSAKTLSASMIWSAQMAEFAPSHAEGTWLFGQWSIADMMFAPVVMRFHLRC